jgi:ABC-type antimicrobial peptide transport system permease subunit
MDAVIPEQSAVPWRVAVAVSWAGVRRRWLRSLVTMLGIVFAIALLSYMLVVDDLTRALVRARDPRLDVLLQKAGVDVLAGGGPDRMMILLVGLALFTCLVGIANAMLMSVTERIREIGTLKCLGALDGFIVRTYLIESALQGLAGALSGTLLGVGVALAVTLASYGGYVFRFGSLPPVLGSVGIAFVSGTVIAVLAAIGPAWWAARRQPVDAMRVEE